MIRRLTSRFPGGAGEIFVAHAAAFIVLLVLFIYHDQLEMMFSREFANWITMPTALLFLGLGIWLMIVARRKVTDKRLRLFLILAGSSGSLFVVGTILHNLFYAVAVSLGDLRVFVIVAEVLHVFSFFAAIFGAPIVFLIGTIGAIRRVRQK